MREILVGFREPEYFILCFAFLCVLCALCGETPLQFSIGGAGGIRTPDLLDAIEARSQLRHGPTGCGNAKKL